MASRELTISVGKHHTDDKTKIELPGTLITPGRGSDTLLTFLCGYRGNKGHYIPHFALPLGEAYNIYVGELRSRGRCNTGKCIDDFAQVDRKLREELAPDTIIYLGHSLGFSIEVAAKNRHGLEAHGLYGICAYPSVGDRYTHSSDIEVKSYKQRLVERLAPKDWGPFGAPLKQQTIEERARFAIGGADTTLNTDDLKVALRFVKYFHQDNPLAGSDIFQGKNHSFNENPGDHAPFNKDNPGILIRDVSEFVESIRRVRNPPRAQAHYSTELP